MLHLYRFFCRYYHDLRVIPDQEEREALMTTHPRNLGRYELQQILGRGGMAEVWKAYDTQLRRAVAIKILHTDLQNDPQFLSRFEREAQAIASLHHPNIVQIYDFHVSRQPELVQEGLTCYMVMTYVEGQTLARSIRNTSRVGKISPVDDIVHLFTKVGSAVDYAHQQGMIHRDLKPANILLDQRSLNAGAPSAMGEPVLSDFGVAKMLGTGSQTQSGMWIGTPSYISPEQIRGMAGNEASDIYSLGIILYEICTGVLPFQGDNTQTLLMNQLNAEPIAPALINPAIPPLLSAVILRCLSKNPEMRFPSAAALATALTQALPMSVQSDLNLTHFVVKPDSSDAGQQGYSFLSSDFSLLPILHSSSPSHPQVSPSVQSLSSPRNQQAIPATPGIEMAEHALVSHVTKNTPMLVSSPSTPAALVSPQPASKKDPDRWKMVVLIVLVIMLLGGGVSAFFLIARRNPAPSPVVAGQVAGHAFFVSSGQVKEQSNQGINDEIEIDLQHVPPSVVDKSYYAWLEADKGMNMVAPVLLGPLLVKNGEVHMLYAGDQAHTNLLAIMSRLLITEESAHVSPTIPSLDSSTWRYTAELPQAAPTSTPEAGMAGMSQLSVLAHLRHLLADAPELNTVGLHGGLDIWLFRNTQKILEWAGSARDEKDTALLHRHLVRILDYLDGIPLVRKDAPGEPVLVNQQIGQIALLDLSQHQVPSVLYTIDFHLNAMLQSSGSTSEQRKLAIQIDTAIKNITAWLENVHQDAVQLVRMSPSQLTQPAALSLLDDMTTQALNAFVGRIDPSSGQIQEGVLQAHFNIQHLATFDIGGNGLSV
jgi:eukaryotic-like serine/threonine-protein kinase